MKKYALGVYEKAIPGDLSWREKLQAAKDAGYDFMEISIDETDAKLARLEWTREERMELVNLMSEIGLPLRSMCLSGHRKYPLGSPDPAIEARSMEIMEKAIQLADDLGVRIIQLAGYDVYYVPSSAETVERFGRNLKKAADMAARLGIVMGFETMETEFMNTVEKSMYWVNATSRTQQFSTARMSSPTSRPETDTWWRPISRRRSPACSARFSSAPATWISNRALRPPGKQVSAATSRKCGILEIRSGKRIWTKQSA